MRMRYSAILETGLAVTAACVYVAWIPFASAADQATANTSVLTEIIVTATKRSEREQDVPSSISVLSAAQMQELHVAGLQDLASYAPGLVINSGGSPGQTSIILRGLNSLQNGALVATLIDDSPVGSSAGWVREDGYQLDLLPYDIERIELLRGPQGTLYGANAMGGVLKYVTINPNLNEFHAQLGGDGFAIKDAGDSGYAARAMFNAPLIAGKLALRVSVYDRKTPGYIDNPLRGAEDENGLTQSGARVALLWQASDDLSIKLQDLYQHNDSKGNASVLARRLGNTAPYAVGSWQGDLTYNHVLPEPFVENINFTSATIDWNVGFGVLTSASSFSDKRIKQMTDASNNVGFLLPLLDPATPPTTSTLVRFDLGLAIKRFTQELRLASPLGRRVEWLVGGFFTDERAQNHQMLEALNSNLTSILSLTPFLQYSAPTTYKESAVFGNLTVHFTDSFDVTGGLRRSKNSQTVEQISSGILLGPPATTIANAGEAVYTYAVSPRYHLTPDTMIYLRVATGYRPGGPNNVLPLYPQIPAQTTADRIINYEAGVKSIFLDRRASVEFAAYKIRWTDLQSSAVTPDGAVGYSINAGSAISEGLEASADYAFSDQLRFAVNAAFTDAYIARSVASVGTLAGARLPTAPKWTASATVDYKLADIQGWTPRFYAGARYVGSEFTEVSNLNGAGEIPGYTLLDVSASVSNGRYDFSLYGKNLSDRRAYSSAKTQTDFRDNSSFFFGSIIQPRTIGLGVDIKF